MLGGVVVHLSSGVQLTRCTEMPRKEARTDTVLPAAG